jgi:hypothetical protein
VIFQLSSFLSRCFILSKYSIDRYSESPPHRSSANAEVKPPSGGILEVQDRYLGSLNTGCDLSMGHSASQFAFGSLLLSSGSHPLLNLFFELEEISIEDAFYSLTVAHS